MTDEIKREIILDNYNNPFHKGLIKDDTYILTNTNNDSCIDEINLMIKIENGIIVDAYFDGEACAICTSSTSIMLNTIVGKTVEEGKKIYENFINMIDDKEYDSEILESAIVYNDISKQPSRKKCALLPWWGLDKAFKKNEEKKVY